MAMEWKWDLVFSIVAVCFALMTSLLTVVLQSWIYAMAKPKPKPKSKSTSTSAMAMEKTNISSTSYYSSFPWDRLPIDIQETILGLLPITALLRCTAVSRSLRSVIRSPSFNYRNYPQPQFLFVRKPTAIADAYDPVLDRWTSFQLPSDFEFLYLCSQHFLLTRGAEPDLYFVYNLLSGELIRIPHGHEEGNTRPDGYPLTCPLVLIPETPQHFKLVKASFSEEDHLYSHIYDSKTGEWTAKGMLQQEFSMLQCGLVCNGLVYCFGRNPDCLLRFDPVGGQWEIVDEHLPAWCCLYIKTFNGRLFFVGGVANGGGVIARIGIWEMDWERIEWRVHCFMPQEVFVNFSRGWRNYFDVAMLKGMFCFIAVRSERNRWCASILMYDLPENRWWWSSAACERRTIELFNRAPQALEPCVDLLKASRWLGGK